MPSYKENLEHAQRILDEINKRKIATPENLQGLPTQFVWKKLNYIRSVVSKKTYQNPVLLLPGLTANITTTLLNVGACQELTQLASFLHIASGRSDITLITLGNNQELKSGNHHADNHMIVMLGEVSYDETMLYTKEKNPSNIPTLDAFFKNQPANVVLLDPLLNFVGRPTDCPVLREYCTSHLINDMLGVIPYQNTLAGIMLPPAQIVAIVKENATRIAEEINEELHQSLMQSARKNKPAKEIFPLLFSKSNLKIDDLIDPHGMTLLHYACLFGEEVLVTYYMSVSPSLMELPNKDGRTPLDCLGAGQGTVKETLESAGEAPSAQDMLSIVAKVKQLKMVLIAKGHHSDWLLRKAAYDGELDTVTSLANMKPERINNVGLPSRATALHQAARKGHADICSFLMNRDETSIDTEDKDGNTPFLLAIKSKHLHLVPLFVKAGADVNKTNAAEESARSLLLGLGQENLLNADLEASAGIVSAAKKLLHFQPAKQQKPAETGKTHEIKF